MALMHVGFFSDTLGLSVSMDVLLPQPTSRQIGMGGSNATGPYKVLYLLHGLSDDHTIWQRRTAIERYCSQLPLAVIMPAVNRSFYTDMASGPRYYTYLTQELPALCAGWFPLSTAREDTYVAGLSMGGYGAFKLALSQPERYGAAASLSGVTDLVSVLGSPERQVEWQAVFGDLSAVPGGSHDLFALADRVAATSGPRPRLYQWCGTDDELYEGNLRFRRHCRRVGLDVDYEEGPGGHSWDLWDAQIQRVLDWLRP